MEDYEYIQNMPIVRRLRDDNKTIRKKNKALKRKNKELSKLVKLVFANLELLQPLSKEINDVINSNIEIKQEPLCSPYEPEIVDNDVEIIKPPVNTNVKLAQRFIFIDSADFTIGPNDNNTFTIDFGETINDVVEIELMSCQLPKTGTTGTELFSYPHNYILLFLDNLELANYKKISGDSAVQNCLHDY